MEIGNKDVYEYISNFTDDKTTINMIRANPKIFDNEKFYEKVMRKRYPLLIDFRKENETWKALYLRMVYTLAKLEEKYQIPYIPTKGCNPERLLATYKEKIYSEALICAAAGGNIPLINYFLMKKGNVSWSDLSRAVEAAGRFSDLDTVKHLISKGAHHYEVIFSGAASGGKIDIMKFALNNLKEEGFDINVYTGHQAMTNAIFYGHISAIDFLIENGMTIDTKFVKYAETLGKYDIAEYLRKFV